MFCLCGRLCRSGGKGRACLPLTLKIKCSHRVTCTNILCHFCQASTGTGMAVQEAALKDTSPHRASLWPNSSKYPECQENPWTRTTAAFVRFPAPHTCVNFALLSSICCTHDFPHFESGVLPCSGDQLLMKSLKEDLLRM